MININHYERNRNSTYFLFNRLYFIDRTSTEVDVILDLN